MTSFARAILGQRLDNEVPSQILIETSSLPIKKFDFDLPIPKPVGPFKMEFGVTGRFGYDLASGQYEAGLSFGHADEKGGPVTKVTSFTKPVFASNPLFNKGIPCVQERTKLVMGDNELSMVCNSCFKLWHSPYGD
jgi:hypothetical protein